MKKWFYPIAQIYLISVLSVILFFLVSDDRLIFHSDFLSLALFFIHFALFPFFIFLSIYFILFLFNKTVDKFQNFYAIMTLSLLFSCFSLWYVNIYRVDVHNFIKDMAQIDISFDNLGRVLGIVLLCFILSYLFLKLVPHAESIRKRIQQLASVCLVLAAILSIGHFGYKFLFKHNHFAQGKHMIFIVIDGMPSFQLSTYNPTMQPTGLDLLANRGQIYYKAYTNKTFTYGFFSTLYTGRLDIQAHQDRMNIKSHVQAPDEVENSLFFILKNHNIKARYLVSHQNGIPEASNIFNYKGLRSDFLSDVNCWFPKLLGLDYHLFLDTSGPRIFGTTNRYYSIYKILNPNATHFNEHKWKTTLIEQIEDIQNYSENSFLILHVFCKEVSTQQEDFNSDNEVGLMLAYASSHDYKITDNYSKELQIFIESYRKGINKYAKRIKGVLDYLESSGRLENTVVVLTADHGTILGRNRILYGYHPDEEVTRVPLFIFGKGLNGQSHDLIDTLDLSETILSYFNVKEKLNPKARSIFNISEKKNVKTITTSSEKRKEQFLVIYDQNNNKYLFNIHPAGNGSAVFGQVVGYDVVNVVDIPADHEIWNSFKEAIVEFKLGQVELHPRFKVFLQ